MIEKGCFQEKKEFPFIFIGENGFRLEESISCNSISDSVKIPKNIRIKFFDTATKNNLLPKQVICTKSITISQPLREKDRYIFLGEKSINLETIGFEIDDYIATGMEINSDDIGYCIHVYLREIQPNDYNKAQPKTTTINYPTSNDSSNSSQIRVTVRPGDEPEPSASQTIKDPKSASASSTLKTTPKSRPPLEAKPPTGYEEAKDHINFWWADSDTKPQDKYQRFRIWLGRKNSEGLWEYKTHELSLSNARAWHGIPSSLIKNDNTRLAVSGCLRWDNKRSVCVQEEIIPISMSRKTDIKPIDSIVIHKHKSPHEILLDPQYIPPIPGEQKVNQTSQSSPGQKTGALKGKLSVKVKFKDGSKVTSELPVWVFIEIHDSKGRVLNVLRNTANQNGIAEFNYADFFQGASKATIVAFCPTANSIRVSDINASGNGKQTETTNNIYYIPATRIINIVNPPKKQIETVNLVLKPMPPSKDNSSGFANFHENILAAVTGNSHKKNFTGNVLHGDHHIWVPVMTVTGDPVRNIATMLLLYNSENKLINGCIRFTELSNNGYTYAQFPAGIFSKDVSYAWVFAWSYGTPGSFIPVSQRLESKKREIFANDYGEYVNAAVEPVTIKLLTSNPAPLRADLSPSAEPNISPKYRHPTRGVANILMLDGKHKPLAGVAARLQADGKFSARAVSGEDGMVSFPLLDGGSFKLFTSVKDYEPESGSTPLSPRPKNLYPFVFKAKIKEFFVSVMLLDAKTGKRLGRTSGQIKASALVDGIKMDTGEYDQNGYVNFKKLQILQSKSDKDILFKIDHPEYEPGEIRFKAGGDQSGDKMLSLQICLRPNTKGLMILINNAKNWQGYSEARQQLRTALIKYIRPVKGTRPGQAEADYQTLVYSALNGNTHVMQKPQLADLSDESLKKLVRGVLGTAATAPYATLKGLARFVDDFKEVLDSAGKWNVVMILAFDPLLSLDSGRAGQDDQKMMDQLIQTLNTQGIELNVVDISDEAAEPRKLLKIACQKTKGTYRVIDRKGVSKLAGELADLFQGRSR